MKIKDIQFLEIKKISEDYISLCHYKNKPIFFTKKNIQIKNKIYKENDKYYIDFNKEDSTIFKKIDDYVCEVVYEKNDITIDKEEFKKKTYTSIFQEDKIKIEVHKNCLILEENELLKQKVISLNNLKNNNYIDIKIHFVGIQYYEKKFEIILLIRKIIKYIEETEHESFEISSSEEDEYFDLLNDNEITKIINDKFPKNFINIDE
jgi:hypothetical protein